jgi:site-specific DNA recombinase
MKRYVALARVSSREQEREGFSLEVQESALKNYADRSGGAIAKFYRLAETASKRDERKAFKELLAYVREHAAEIDGVLFYKVDRAARNLFDYVELERLEADCGVPVIYVAQPTENTPAGRMQRRILSNMATFYTEQQSVDVCEGLARRVQSGLFVGKAPYGYVNRRHDGRSLVEVEPQQAAAVRRIFELYAFHSHTLDSLAEQLTADGIEYNAAQPEFTRSKLHSMLRDRAYVGEVRYRDGWHPGQHQPLVDSDTFERVQLLLGEKTYNARDSVYGAGMVVCGHCGKQLVVEIKEKSTAAGPRTYRYYRCAAYNKGEHPRVRLNEAEFDKQVLSLIGRMRIDDEALRDWIVSVLRAKSKTAEQSAVSERDALQRELEGVRKQKQRLLDLRLLDEIESSTFAEKQAELRSKETRLQTKLEGCGRQQSERADLAVKAFELSQSLTSKWLAADIAEKRLLLEIICLNWTLDGVTLVPQMRKPFDVLVEGLLVSSSRGDTPLPLVNETKGIRLIRRMLPKLVVLQRDAILRHVEPGQYAKPRK